MRGGNGVNYSLSPSEYAGEGQGLGNSLDVQVEAGMAGGKRRRRGTRRRGTRRRGTRRRSYRGGNLPKQGGARRRRTRRSRR